MFVLSFNLTYVKVKVTEQLDLAKDKQRLTDINEMNEWKFIAFWTETRFFFSGTTCNFNRMRFL